MSCLGLDIGGAHLKAANIDGWVETRFFPLWRNPTGLAGALAELIASAPTCSTLAITMTGELADCYQTKADGVRHICQAASEAGGGRPLRVYTTHGEFVSPDEAARDWLATAAANWHALARYAACTWQIEAGVLFDLGSTTCDIIPLVDREPASQGRTDPARLASGELVYSGVVRSPVCALVRALPHAGQMCPTAQEVFATTLDAYLMLGQIPESIDGAATADGRPATRACAHDRLARSICADRQIFDEADALASAEVIKAAQLELIRAAAVRVIGGMGVAPRVVVLSGQGEFLLDELCRHHELFGDRGVPEFVSMTERLGAQLSRAATAYAVAVLAEDAR